MGTISCKVVKAKKKHWCDLCKKSIEIGEYYISLFGSVDSDKPHVQKMCMGKTCGLWGWHDDKLIKAVNDYKKRIGA